MLVDLPVLYSFRRCPYAIRARMAVSYSAIAVELREVVLRDMPASLLACSPKGTVPVLVLPGGAVLEESRDIIDWALANSDPDGWLQGAGDTLREQVRQLVDTCDTPFKQQLDYYKYAERYPQHSADYYRSQGQLFLGQLEQYLESCDWLCGDHMTVADVSIFPFVRQFANVDKASLQTLTRPGLTKRRICACRHGWTGCFVRSCLPVSWLNTRRGGKVICR
jgi:glutathione S-transferase